MIVSAASLFFRDVKFIVEVLLTFGIFFTPVFYDIGMFGDKGKWLLLNPVAPILDGFSACVARHQSPNLRWFAYSFGFAVCGDSWRVCLLQASGAGLRGKHLTGESNV